MQRVLYRYLECDHLRLNDLFLRAFANPKAIDLVSYAEFRVGLLRHIGVEEKIVLPAIARRKGGRRSEITERIHLDHAAIVALLVPPPSPGVTDTLRHILRLHNAIEEQEGGLYETLESIASPDAQDLFRQLSLSPKVPVLGHNRNPVILDAVRRAVARAGYEWQNKQA